MKITVDLFASFRVDRFKQQQREYPPGITFGQVVADLGIKDAEIGMALVNARHAPLDQELSDNDNLSLFPMLGGG